MPIATVMIVEDDADTLEIITAVLSDAGYRVIAGNGITTVYNIEKDPPDLLIIDNWLSGDKTGHDICYQLKQNPATSFIPVLLISGTMNLEDTAQRCGANGFICKPFYIDNLLDQVKFHTRA